MTELVITVIQSHVYVQIKLKRRHRVKKEQAAEDSNDCFVATESTVSNCVSQLRCCWEETDKFDWIRTLSVLLPLRRLWNMMQRGAPQGGTRLIRPLILFIMFSSYVRSTVVKSPTEFHHQILLMTIWTRVGDLIVDIRIKIQNSIHQLQVTLHRGLQK